MVVLPVRHFSYFWFPIFCYPSTSNILHLLRVVDVTHNLRIHFVNAVDGVLLHPMSTRWQRQRCAVPSSSSCPWVATSFSSKNSSPLPPPVRSLCYCIYTNPFFFSFWNFTAYAGIWLARMGAFLSRIYNFVLLRHAPRLVARPPALIAAQTTPGYLRRSVSTPAHLDASVRDPAWGPIVAAAAAQAYLPRVATTAFPEPVIRTMSTHLLVDFETLPPSPDKWPHEIHGRWLNFSHLQHGGLIGQELSAGMLVCIRADD